MARPNLTIAVGDWNALNVKLTYLAGRTQNLDENGDIPIASVIIATSDTVTFYDDGFFIVDDLDPTKRARFEVSGISAATTRVYTLQDSDDTLVGRATTDTLTNKTWNGVKIGLAYGGTNADLSATGGANQLLKQASAGAAVTVGTIASANLSDSTNIPLLNASNAFTGTETITFSGNTIAFKTTDTTVGIYTLQNTICFNYDQNADGIAAVNWKGYQGGVTKYRDFIIYDGKANALITVTASTAAVGFAGAIISGTWNGTKIGLAYGGSNADLSATGGASQVLQQVSSGAAITVGQLAASNLSNGTTGSGSVVLATGPTVTTLNVSDKNLQLNAAQFQSFVVVIRNNGGTLQHGIFSSQSEGTASNVAGKVSGASTTFATMPYVAAGTNFTSGGGSDNTSKAFFVFNTAAQVEGDPFVMVNVEYNSTGTGVVTGIRNRNINVNGTTRNWLAAVLFNSTTGAAFTIDTTNIPAGTQIDIRIYGFVY